MQQAASKEYSKELFNHRYHLGLSGFFQPMLEAIQAHTVWSPDHLLLDAGCGEGSQLATLLKGKADQPALGLDIAKEGIHMAASHYGHTALWATGDVNRLPLQDQAVSTLFNILTPSSYKEFRRVLMPGGRLIKVVPGPAYLQELRQILYTSQPEKQVYSNQAIRDRFFAEFPNAREESLTYHVALDDQTYQDLLGMTPLIWGASKEDVQLARQAGLSSITVDYLVLHAKQSAT